MKKRTMALCGAGALIWGFLGIKSCHGPIEWPDFNFDFFKGKSSEEVKKKKKVIPTYPVAYTQTLCSSKNMAVVGKATTRDYPKNSAIIQSLRGTYFVRPEFVAANWGLRDCGGMKIAGALVYETGVGTLCAMKDQFLKEMQEKDNIQLRLDFDPCEYKYFDFLHLGAFDPLAYGFIREQLETPEGQKFKEYLQLEDSWLREISRDPWVSDYTLAEVVSQKDIGMFTKKADIPGIKERNRSNIRAELKKAKKNANRRWRQHVVPRLR